jgi:hypothetical protein
MRARIAHRTALAIVAVGVSIGSGVGAYAYGTDTPTAERASPAALSAEATSCLLTVRWRGRWYDAVGVEVSPRLGRRVGVGLIPDCPNEPGAPIRAPSPVDLAALPGARPRDVVVMVGADDLVLVRRSLPARKTPAAVKRLLTAPRCTSTRPVRLLGQWLGILSANGRTEVDLVPPYVLHIHVRSASERRYVRAFLTLRVTARTRGLITRDEIENVLWEGGDLAATVRCVRGRYMARSLDPRPPG